MGARNHAVMDDDVLDEPAGEAGRRGTESRSNKAWKTVFRRRSDQRHPAASLKGDKSYKMGYKHLAPSAAPAAPFYHAPDGYSLLVLQNLSIEMPYHPAMRSPWRGKDQGT
jgi:hypothetical protein